MYVYICAYIYKEKQHNFDLLSTCKIRHLTILGLIHFREELFFLPYLRPNIKYLFPIMH